MAPLPARVFRFGDFELDVSGYELRRNDRPIRLERQPMDLLILLVERRRALVTRDEIVARLWGADVFVDVETGINTAVRKIRQALNEAPHNGRPAIVQTVSGKGYRFVADVIAAPASGPNTGAAMLAVLPFVNLTRDAGRDYLADGLTEDAIAALSQIDRLRLQVIGRTSAMAYRASTKPLTRIASELNADFLVQGSMRDAGSMLRIDCELTRAADQSRLWSASFERDARGLADVAREVSAGIAEQIQLESPPELGAIAAGRQSTDAAAYDAYLRGRRFWNQLTPMTTRKAVEYYTRATEADPTYALAWAGLAEAFASAPINGDADPRAMWQPARDAAEKAVAANPNLSEAHHVCGQVNWMFEWNWPAALSSLRRAISLDPSSAWSNSMAGHLLSQMGRHEEARPFMERACALEPMSPLPYAMASQVAFQARDFEAARQRARRAIVIDPEFWIGHMMLGQACEQLHEEEIALDALATAARLSDGNSKPVGLRGYILADRGDTAAAREVLAVLEDLTRLRYVPPFARAVVHAGLREDERVFECLDCAYDARDVHLVFLTVDPKWDRFRAAPAFRALIERCGFDANQT